MSLEILSSPYPDKIESTLRPLSADSICNSIRQRPPKAFFPLRNDPASF